MLLRLAREVGATRLVYTSSLEVSYEGNSCVGAREETTPYSAFPTNGYQRSKIVAEREVLAASSPAPDGSDLANNDSTSLATVVIRPAHIFGHLDEDEIGRYISSVPLNFQSGQRGVSWSDVRGAQVTCTRSRAADSQCFS